MLTEQLQKYKLNIRLIFHETKTAILSWLHFINPTYTCMQGDVDMRWYKNIWHEVGQTIIQCYEIPQAEINACRRYN